MTPVTLITHKKGVFMMDFSCFLDFAELSIMAIKSRGFSADQAIEILKLQSLNDIYEKLYDLEEYITEYGKEQEE